VSCLNLRFLSTQPYFGPSTGWPLGRCLTVLGPFVLPADLLLLLGGEIVGDVECLADLLRRFALDHVGDGLAANIQECLDIKVVRGLC